MAGRLGGGKTVSRPPQAPSQAQDRNKPSLSRLYLASILPYLSALSREKSWFIVFIYGFFSISKEVQAMFDVRREAQL